MIKRLYSIILILFLCSSGELSATHNRAGEIIYEQIGPLTIRATIKTYTKASSVAADRDSLELFWGDGTSDILLRANNGGEGDVISGLDVKINCYVGEHTYSSRATYTLSFIDPNRVSDILNVNFPNSVDIPFYLETTFTLLNTQFQGLNNSVLLLNPPLDYACRDEIFIHNPNAFDSDGDSIGYELIVPFMDVDIEVPNYQYPDAIMPGIDNIISLDELTGDFVWNTPQAAGEYNIAIKISEYRNGEIISSTVRDMQIFVDDCNNSPPNIASDEEICIIAGEELVLPLEISDPDFGDRVLLSANGGPFLTQSPFASLTDTEAFFDAPFDAEFRWQTTCDHVQKEYYQVVFRAVDLDGLVDLHTVRIKVLAPPPEDVEVMNTAESNILSWELPYACDATTTDNFLGFSVWRSIGSIPLPEEECDHGLEGKGYERLIFLTDESNNGRYEFIDNNLEPNTIYCYRVTALLSRLTVAQSPINVVESIPSKEVCILSSRDVPFIVQNTVEVTDPNNGTNKVRWLLPDPTQYDTTVFTGPYTVELFANGQQGTNTLLYTYDEEYFDDLIVLDSFSHSGINTLDFQGNYFVKLISGVEENESVEATTVFLDPFATDEEVILSWNENVPWQNIEYRIYKEINNVFTEIGQTSAPPFRDTNLENGTEYCYLIESRGTFSIEPFPEPVINFSQIVCVTPIDNKPPCPLPLGILSACDQLAENPSLEEYFNILNWNKNLIECPENSDITNYEIYYSPNEENFEFIGSVNESETEYIDERFSVVGGCYYIIALDELNNASPPSDTICVDKCSIYELPNTFTPNGDNFNDLFVPRKNLFVEEVDFRVFNKWGNLIYKTSDPELNWNGQDMGGKEVDDGTYYYSCEIFQANDIGILEGQSLLSGYIEVLR